MPGTLVTLPQAGDEVTATWGQSVAGALNGMQVGSATVAWGAGVQALTSIAFPRAFTTAPLVVISGGSSVVIIGTQSITTTGFVAAATRRDGNGSAGNTTGTWIAVGTLA